MKVLFQLHFIRNWNLRKNDHRTVTVLIKHNFCCRNARIELLVALEYYCQNNPGKLDECKHNSMGANWEARNQCHIPKITLNETVSD